MIITNYLLKPDDTNNMCILAIQGENGYRKLNFSIDDDTLELNEWDCYFYVNNKAYDVEIDTHNKIISVILNKEICSDSGIKNCWLQLTKDKNEIRIGGLRLNIKPCNIDEEIANSEDYSTLINLIHLIQQTQQKSNIDMQTISDNKDTVISKAQEVADNKTAVDNTVSSFDNHVTTKTVEFDTHVSENLSQYDSTLIKNTVTDNTIHVEDSSCNNLNLLVQGSVGDTEINVFGKNLIDITNGIKANCTVTVDNNTGYIKISGENSTYPAYIINLPNSIKNKKVKIFYSNVITEGDVELKNQISYSINGKKTYCSIKDGVYTIPDFEDGSANLAVVLNNTNNKKTGSVIYYNFMLLISDESNNDYEAYKSQSQIVTIAEENTPVNVTGLKSYFGTTNIFNSANNIMTATYIADSKLYIDEKFNKLSTALIAAGGEN